MKTKYTVLRLKNKIHRTMTRNLTKQCGTIRRKSEEKKTKDMWKPNFFNLSRKRKNNLDEEL
jgi:hypothetical protein